MPLCKHFFPDSQASRLIPSSQPIDFGDIYVVRGSIALPILELFKGDQTMKTAFSQKTQDDYESYPHLNKARPAIIVKTRPKDNLIGGWHPPIWYMATFQNTSEYRSLPRLYKHFLMAVNSRALHRQSPNEDRHIHTLPEWRGSSQQWVLALEYTPPANYWGSGRWESPGDEIGDPLTHYAVDAGLLQKARGYAEEQLNKYMVDTPRRLKLEMRDEFFRHLRERKKENASHLNHFSQTSDLFNCMRIRLVSSNKVWQMDT
ncbi:hypothetical protein JAAARDRAFT_527394 [Jaapia argillacea MUCL 33604]|uniref:Uncharacterized protein n=1 Tax=Jaapia argillacea MUCL 33604 TaxID=933084 RepID=A0A067Q4I8_9AGAM|nr:hypothetical protein JAAARDRAFT_527394 [Jaapia argillacea MUCL 33604]